MMPKNRFQTPIIAPRFRRYVPEIKAVNENEGLTV
jgi:hypothetical protein